MKLNYYHLFFSSYVRKYPEVFFLFLVWVGRREMKVQEKYKEKVDREAGIHEV